MTSNASIGLPLCESLPSIHYTDSHVSFRNKIRQFINTEINPYINKWEAKGSIPLELYQKAYNAGVYTPQFPISYGGQPPKNPKTNKHEWDAFYFLIFTQEMALTGSGGIVTSLWFCTQIGLSPLISKYCTNNYIKQTIVPKLMCGKEIVCLAVSEPSAGSDVSNIKCNATADPTDENFVIINGEKMFISNGLNSDYFTTIVKTDKLQLDMIKGKNKGKGKGNYTSKKQKKFDTFSVFLIPKNTNGIYVSKLKTQGWWCGNTTHIIFKNVKIDKRKYLVGKIGNGWKIIMENFNLERFAGAIHAIGYSRCCLIDSINYAKERETFGKKLIKHQVIRHKIVQMMTKIESTQALLEHIAFLYNSNKCSEKEISPIVALAKVQATKVLDFCAREAIQIFGGRGYIIGGRAARVERIYREVRVCAIGGGSEEILMDFVVNQSKL